jgi:hypothetical protein
LLPVGYRDVCRRAGGYSRAKILYIRRSMDPPVPTPLLLLGRLAASYLKVVCFDRVHSDTKFVDFGINSNK